MHNKQTTYVSKLGGKRRDKLGHSTTTNRDVPIIGAENIYISYCRAWRRRWVSLHTFLVLFTCRGLLEDTHVDFYAPFIRFLTVGISDRDQRPFKEQALISRLLSSQLRPQRLIEEIEFHFNLILSHGVLAGLILFDHVPRIFFIRVLWVRKWLERCDELSRSFYDHRHYSCRYFYLGGIIESNGTGNTTTEAVFSPTGIETIENETHKKPSQKTAIIKNFCFVFSLSLWTTGRGREKVRTSNSILKPTETSANVL